MVGFSQLFADLEGQLASLGLRAVGLVGLSLIVLVLLSGGLKTRWPKLKLPLFLVMAGSIVGVTGLLITSTIYLNLNSDSGGPVHWHAGIEFWGCGTELELRDPYKFLSNKLGSPVLHEHNDKWIHLEGVVVDLEEDASLGHFMETIGGKLQPGLLRLPINTEGSFIEDTIDGDRSLTNIDGRSFQDHIKHAEDGSRYLEFIDGRTCDAETAEVQVFAYQFDEMTNTYKQTKLVSGARVLQQVGVGHEEIVKLSSASDFIINDSAQLPPGDCIIIEFASPRDFYRQAV